MLGACRQEGAIQLLRARDHRQWAGTIHSNSIRGTTVVKVEPQIRDSHAMESSLVEKERQKPLILVINDTQEILDLFREILEEEGWDVVLSSFGVQEVADVQRVDPDLVILDFLIGGEAQGWQLLQKLRMTRATEKLPIIVCTAAIQLVKELEGHLTSKNVGLILKPFDIDELVEAVHKGLRAGGIAGNHNVRDETGNFR